MDLALFEPDIPQNTGTMIRLGACLDIPVHVIEPCGFAFSEKSFRRAGLDYIELADIRHHASWRRFEAWRRGEKRRLVLLSAKADAAHTAFSFRASDILMVGRETSGVPTRVFEACDARIRIPMRAGVRSLNVATAAAMVLGEALRQTKTYPKRSRT